MRARPDRGGGGQGGGRFPAVPDGHMTLAGP